MTCEAKNPVDGAKRLVRSMIKAPPGKILMGADYNSIEYILLMWAVDDFEAVKRFEEGFDQYKDMAVAMTGVPYDEITDDQRTQAKPVVLGAGFGLGPVGYVGYAEGFGLTLTLDESKKSIYTYRNRHPNVPDMWYKSKDAMLAAISNPGQMSVYRGVKYKVVADKTKRTWLTMEIRSGEKLFYCEPGIQEGRYGPVPNHMGIDSKTKQWVRKELIPGRIVENQIQALARDIQAHGMLKVDEEFDIIMSTHDEIWIETVDIDGPEGEKNKEQFDRFIELMTDRPPWAAGIPIKAEGYIGYRFKKM